MSRVISLRLEEEVEARLSGAAVLNGQTVSAYIKGLIGSDRAASDTGIATILQRLDELAAALADVRTQGVQPTPVAPDLPAPSVKLKRCWKNLRRKMLTGIGPHDDKCKHEVRSLPRFAPRCAHIRKRVFTAIPSNNAGWRALGKCVWCGGVFAS